jgi:hypothetical protein
MAPRARQAYPSTLRRCGRLIELVWSPPSPRAADGVRRRGSAGLADSAGLEGRGRRRGPQENFCGRCWPSPPPITAHRDRRAAARAVSKRQSGGAPARAPLAGRTRSAPASSTISARARRMIPPPIQVEMSMRHRGCPQRSPQAHSPTRANSKLRPLVGEGSAQAPDHRRAAEPKNPSRNQAQKPLWRVPGFNDLTWSCQKISRKGLLLAASCLPASHFRNFIKVLAVVGSPRGDE